MTKTKFEVMDECNPLDIPVGPILSMKEIMEDEGLQATGTIEDNDDVTVSIADVTDGEANGPFEFAVTLSGAADQTVTVDYDTMDVEASHRMD